MAKRQIRINVDADVEKEAENLFRSLGLDMSTAVNMFLCRCVLCGGIPLSVSYPDYNGETLEAMEEARRISKDPSVARYRNMEALIKALEDPDREK